MHLLDEPIVSLFTSFHDEITIHCKVIRELDFRFLSLRKSTRTCTNLHSAGKDIKPIASEYSWIASSGQPDPIFAPLYPHFLSVTREMKPIRWLFWFETQKERYTPQYDN